METQLVAHHGHAAVILSLHGVTGSFGSLLAALLNVSNAHTAALACSTGPPRDCGTAVNPVTSIQDSL